MLKKNLVHLFVALLSVSLAFIPLKAEENYSLNSMTKIKEMLNSQDYKLRLDALSFVSKLPKEDALIILSNTVKDDNVWVRASSIINYFSLSPSKSLQILKSSVNDEDLRIRILSVWALSYIKDPQVLEIFDKSIKDNNVQVRMMTAWAIGNSQIREALPILIDNLSEPDSFVKIEIAKSISKIGNNGVIKDILPFLKHSNPKIRAAFLQTIGELYSEDSKYVIKEVENALEDNDPMVRLSASEVLYKIGTFSSIKALAKHINDTDKNVALASSVAILKINSGKTLKK